MNKEEIALMYYDVTPDGVVMNRINGKVLRPGITDRGYKKFLVSRGGIRFRMFVHRLVAYKYIPNPNGYAYINHIDCNKLNNRVENLEWCTMRMNIDHAISMGIQTKYGEIHKNSRLRNIEVIDIRSRIAKGETFKNIYGDYSGRISWWTFRNICRGKTWRHVA